jgi:BASS family bile acid:Na+ symporter
LAAVLNAVNTALSPFMVPVLFLTLTGIELHAPVGMVIGELVLTVLVPTVAGVWLRTRYPRGVGRFDPAYSSAGSVVYLVLLLAVLGPNAEIILGYEWYALLVAAAALALNLIGYAVGATACWFTDDRQERIAYLFTVSKKEFSIAAAFIAASGLSSEIMVPAVFYAVVQMITSPVAAKLLAADAGTVECHATPVAGR